MLVRKSSLLLSLTAASLLTLCVAAGCHSQPPPAAAASSALQLQPYTASDQSASAGVPSGWTLSEGADNGDGTCYRPPEIDSLLCQARMSDMLDRPLCKVSECYAYTSAGESKEKGFFQ